MPNFKKISDSLSNTANFVKNSIYLIGVIMLICGSVWLTIDRTFDAKVLEMTTSLDQRITAVESYTTDQIEKNILKQAEKINKQQYTDIKEADLEDALKYYPMLKNPTQKVSLAYELVKEYYKNNF